MGEAEATEWVEAATVEEFDSTDRKRIDLGGMNKIGLFKVNDDFFAVNAFCTHARVEMTEGDLDEYELMCPLHGAVFDIRDGSVCAPPAFKSVQTYPTKVENGKVFIQAP